MEARLVSSMPTETDCPGLPGLGRGAAEGTDVRLRIVACLV